MSDMMSALEEMRLQSIQALRCENCEEVQAALWCQTCEVAACQSCMDATHGAKILQRHTRVPVSDRWKTQGPPKCLEHGELLRYMCMTCDVVSCTDCMNYGLHKGHVHELVTAVADGHRSQLQEHVRAAEAADVEAAEAARAAEQVIHQIGAEPSPVTSGGTRASAKQKITEAFRSFREALDAREQELMTKVDSLADEKLTAARKQLNELGMHRSTLHVAREVAEQTLAMAPWEFSARYKRCIEILQTAARAEIPDAVDASIPVSLATDEVLSTIASFGSVGGPGAPLEAHCELQGSTAVVTWQPPASSALPVVAYVVQRAVGEAGRYAPTGRTNGARLEQCVDDLAGQSLRYRVRAEDEGGNVGAWVQSPAVQLPETFGIELRFQSPFDENGVLHHIGTAGGQREYQNPHNTGDVVASMSSIGHNSSVQPRPLRAAHARGAREQLHVRPDPPRGWRWTF